jgi:hypothetical protein
VIQPIVEGHGDVSAFPALLRHLLNELGIYDVEVGKPIRLKRFDLTQPDRLRRAVDMAWRQPRAEFVIVLFDADDDCPARMAPQVLQWAREVRSQQCAVVMACREYEAWFLAAAESLRGTAAIRPDATYHGDPESPRGAKEALESLMESGANYVPTADQAKLSAVVDVRTVFARSRSFRHLVTSLEPAVRESSGFPGRWPPQHL